MQITLRSDLGKPIKLKWLKLITESPDEVDWEKFTDDLSETQPDSDLILDVETTHGPGQCKWINGQWYGSILDDQNQQNIPLLPNEIPDFLGINTTIEITLGSDENEESEIVFSKKRDSKGIIALLIITIAASIVFQITYQNFQSSDRHDIPEYTVVANFETTLGLLTGQYASGMDVNESYIEIRLDKSVTMNAITQIEPALESYIDENWTITDIGINDNGFIIILNDELSLIIDNSKQLIDFYGDTFKRI